MFGGLYHYLKGCLSSLFQVLEKSRWNIFIFSKAALADPGFRIQFDAAINASINDDELQVIYSYNN